MPNPKRIVSLPTYSSSEERFHVISHLLGVLLAFVSFYLTILLHHDNLGLVSGLVFSSALLILYTASCLYHAMMQKNFKQRKILQIADHCAIFILIAGTCTPLILCSIGRFSPVVAAVHNLLIWGSAIVGIVLLSIDLTRFKRVSIILYLLMGFSMLAETYRLMDALGKFGFALLLVGGFIYCIGLIFYSIKMPWTHAVFHALCVVASSLHCGCILLYVI